MALEVKLKGSENPLLDLGKAANLESLATTLNEAGCKMVLQPKTASIQGVGGLVHATITVNTDAFNMLLLGKLAPASAQTIIGKVETLLHEAAKSLNLSGGGAGTAGINPSDLTYVDDPGVPTTPAQTTTVASTGPAAGSPVKLTAASVLHQPVTASSAGSVYHVVALGDGINIAARMKRSGTTWGLSIRAEGHNLKQHATALTAQGMTYNGSYASHHLNGEGGELMMLRCLGAYLMGLNIQFNQMSTKPVGLTNKGK